MFARLVTTSLEGGKGRRWGGRGMILILLSTIELAGPGC
jgi:hypothetical protein